MNSAKDHYDRQLAAVYSWMSGSSEAALQRNRDLFRQMEIGLTPGELAIDLGAGSGFQSIPLAELGFSVVAVDFCESLLTELKDRANHLAIRAIHDDMVNFAQHVQEQAQVIVCIGDTLTHLASFDVVESLIESIALGLVIDGKLILTFRDYVSNELQGAQRFIPVRSGESKILTCFLEYREDTVEVHDLLYRKEGDQWIFNASSYPKLRIDRDWLCDRLQASGLSILFHEMMSGMICIVAQKSKP